MIIEEWAPNFKAPTVRFRLVFWEFRKLGVPYFGILIIRILLFRGTVFGSPIFGNSPIFSPILSLGGNPSTLKGTRKAITIRGLNNYQCYFGVSVL